MKTALLLEDMTKFLFNNPFSVYIPESETGESDFSVDFPEGLNTDFDFEKFAIFKYHIITSMFATRWIECYIKDELHNVIGIQFELERAYTNSQYHRFLSR